MNALYQPWPNDGCSLAEALRRVSDRRMWQNYRAATQERDNLCGGPSWISGGLDRYEWGARQNSESRIGERVAKLVGQIDTAFHRLILTKRLVAYGRLGDIMSSPQIIPADVWGSLHQVNWSNSTAREFDASGAVFKAIRVYPAVLAPDSAMLVSDRRLSEVFKLFVFEDPEFVALAGEALGRDIEIQNVTEGSFRRDTHCWPADLSGYDGPPEAIENRQETINAWNCLRHRFAQLVRLLQNGVLNARGSGPASGQVSDIASSSWSNSSACIDIQTGVLLHKDKDELSPRWSDIMFHVKPMRHDGLRHTTIAPQTSDVALPAAATFTESAKEIPSERLTAGRQATKPRPKSRVTSAALGAAGINLATDDRSSKEISIAIASYLPQLPKSEAEQDALQKMINRLRRAARK